MSNSILQDWVVALPIRHQGVLIAAVRGCDGLPKENNAKPLVRAVRGMFLRPADARELDFPSAFMSLTITGDERNSFFSDWDMYPMHFIQHLMHACQVIGYKHPSGSRRALFFTIYQRFVHKLHLNPESEIEMDRRLTEDRIARYNAANAPE